MAVAELDVMRNPEAGWRDMSGPMRFSRCGACGLLRHISDDHNEEACRAYRRGYLAGLSDAARRGEDALRERVIQ